MPPKAADGAFDRLVDHLCKVIVDLDPVQATCLGIHGDNDFRLPDLTRETCERTQAELQGIHRELGALRDRDLSLDHQVDLRLARGGIAALLLRMHKYPCWRQSPKAYVDAAVFGFLSLIVRESAPQHHRARALLARLEEVPTLLDRARTNLENPSAIFTETAAMSARGATHYIQTAVRHFIMNTEDPELRASLGTALEVARGALENYREWLEGTLMPQSRGEFAIGRSSFDRLIADQHHLPWDADDLIAVGQRVYQDTMREMKRVAARIDPTRPWSKVVESLKEIYPEPQSLLHEYRTEMERARRFVVEHELVDIPDGEAVHLCATPEFARPLFPYAHYIRPPILEKSMHGIYWVTTIDGHADEAHREMMSKGHALYRIPARVVHDSYPGHHVQSIHSARLDGHPIRHLFGSSQFEEGWALYCEELMFRHGFFTDDRIRLLQLKDLLWRACRVIIDVELHTGRMGFNEAATFLVRKAHLERMNAVAEVRRYCTAPTQPMSYVAGLVQILELIEDVKARGNFDLRRFHGEFLRHGPLPIELLRMQMGIERREQGGRSRRQRLPQTIP